MKNKLFAPLFALIFTVIVVRPVYAQSFARSGEQVVVDKDEVVNHDYFAAGNTIVIAGMVNGDAYVAGEKIVVSGVINGDLLSAGKDIEITGSIHGDVRVAGEVVNITGTVDGNVTAGAGTLDIGQSAIVKGSMVVGGKDVAVSGKIGKSVTAGGETIAVDGAIGGDLNYWSQKDVAIASGAGVAGTITRHDLPQNTHPPQKVVTGGGVAGMSLFSGLSAFIIGALVLRFFPIFINNAVENISKKPLSWLGKGLLFILGVPLILIAIMITIVGIPLAFVGFILYGLTCGIARIGASVFIGRNVVRLLGVKANQYFELLVGIIVSAILMMIPIFGWLAAVAIFLIALGALLNSQKIFYHTLKEKKLA